MNKRNALKISALAALLMLGSALVLAGPRHGGFQPGPGHGPGFGPPMDDEARIERMAAHLDLTEAQQADIEQILESHRAAAEPKHQAFRAAHDAFQALLDADTLDEVAIRSAAEQVAAAQVELMVDRALLRDRIHQVLTPEQLAEARSVHERRQSRREERRERRLNRRQQGPVGLDSSGY